MVRPCMALAGRPPRRPVPAPLPLQGSPVVRHTPAHAPPRCGPRLCEYCRPSVAPQPLLGLGVAPEDSFRGRRARCSTLASGLLRCAHGAGCHLTRSNSAFRG